MKICMIINRRNELMRERQRCRSRRNYRLRRYKSKQILNEIQKGVETCSFRDYYYCTSSRLRNTSVMDVKVAYKKAEIDFFTG